MQISVLYGNITFIFLKIKGIIKKGKFNAEQFIRLTIFIGDLLELKYVK